MTEKFMKEKADEMINKFKSDSAKRGLIITEENERYMRAGMSYGIILASMTLSMLPIEAITEDFTK